MNIASVITLLSDHRRLAFFLGLVSAAALGFAYVSEYFFNLQPCILCLYQRKPYWLIIALALIAGGVKSPRILGLIIAGMFLAVLANMGLSGYHVGVEQGWLEGTKACAGAKLPVGSSLEDLRNYLNNQPIVRCDVPAWKLFGISMTGYNFMLSVFLAAVTAYFGMRGRKHG
jgi:disulfide bond formation protein DsbB